MKIYILFFFIKKGVEKLNKQIFISRNTPEIKDIKQFNFDKAINYWKMGK